MFNLRIKVLYKLLRYIFYTVIVLSVIDNIIKCLKNRITKNTSTNKIQKESIYPPKKQEQMYQLIKYSIKTIPII